MKNTEMKKITEEGTEKRINLWLWEPEEDNHFDSTPVIVMDYSLGKIFGAKRLDLCLEFSIEEAKELSKILQEFVQKIEEEEKNGCFVAS